MLKLYFFTRNSLELQHVSIYFGHFQGITEHKSSIHKNVVSLSKVGRKTEKMESERKRDRHRNVLGN
jgi:hypothetical protein